MDGYYFVILDVGKRRIATDDLVDDEQLISGTRVDDALIFEWAAGDLDPFDPPEETAETLVSLLGDLLRLHRDARGILVTPSSALEGNLGGSYAAIVAKLEGAGKWIANTSNERGATGSALERSEIPLPDIPRSRRIELYLLSPARAMRELGLTEPPMRVAVNDRDTAMTVADVIKFYLPLLKKMGFAVKRRIWSDGTTEQLVAHTPSHHVIVHAEKSKRTFVRLAWIAKPFEQVAGASVVLISTAGPIVLSSSAASWEPADAVADVPTGMRAVVVGSCKVTKGDDDDVLRYEVEVDWGHLKKRGWVDGPTVRTL